LIIHFHKSQETRPATTPRIMLAYGAPMNPRSTVLSHAKSIEKWAAMESWSASVEIHSEHGIMVERVEIRSAMVSRSKSRISRSAMVPWNGGRGFMAERACMGESTELWIHQST